MNKTELAINLLKSSYPLFCFGLAGVIGIAAIINSDRLSNERWISIVGLVSSAITAGAGIAQAPQSGKGISYSRNEGGEHEELKSGQ